MLALTILFISSTVEDLKECRAAARDSALALGFKVVMQEYFEASGNPPFSECMTKVHKADVVVAIVAHRYGWIPEDQPEPRFEEEHHVVGMRESKGVLAFVQETYELMQWFDRKHATPKGMP